MGRRSDTVYTKALVDAISDRMGADRQDVQDIIQELTEVIGACLANGYRVNVAGLGSFSVKKVRGAHRPERMRKDENIAKGTTIRVSFTKSPVLKELLKMENEEEIGMDKYAVDETAGAQTRDLDKMAAAGCPVCGRTPERHGNTLLCPVHGSEPFEG